MTAAAFGRQLLLALAISAAGAVVHSALASIFGSAIAIRLTLLTVALIYLLSLLRNAPRRSGRLLSALVWLGLAGLLLLFNPPLMVWALSQIGLIWLLRSLQRYQSLVAAGADALLCGLAIAAAMTTALHTGSLFLCLWSFFLIQALLVFVRLPQGSPRNSGDSGEHDFESSLRTAEAALRRLSLRV
jgi:hypothetical protein